MTAESETIMKSRIREAAECCRDLAVVFKKDSEEVPDPNDKWYLYGVSVAYQEVSDRLYGMLEYMEKVKE